MSNSPNKRVVITGVGIVSPIGLNKEEFLFGLKSGKNGFSFDKEMEEFNMGCRVSARLPISEDQYARFLKELKLIKMRRPSITYGLLSVKEAWEDAGFIYANKHEEPLWDTGIIYGSESPSVHVIHWARQHMFSGNVRKLGSMMVQQAQNSGIVLYLNGKLGIGNIIFSTAQGCATGSNAIALGYERIKYGKAKRMIVGSSETEGPLLWGSFDSLMALNRQHNDTPEQASRPMSSTAAGLIPGVGAATLILEEYDYAMERGAKIYAEVKGAALNTGGQKGIGSMTMPNPDGIKRCIWDALEEAQLNPEDIDLISGHLTSTAADPIEIRSWKEALNRSGENFPYVNSLKSMVGHTFGAAGSMAAVAILLQMENNFVHPSINSEDLHPEIENMVDRSRIPLSAVENTPIRTAIQSSFGFGDMNAVLVFQKVD